MYKESFRSLKAHKLYKRGKQFCLMKMACPTKTLVRLSVCPTVDPIFFCWIGNGRWFAPCQNPSFTWVGHNFVQLEKKFSTFQKHTQPAFTTTTRDAGVDWVFEWMTTQQGQITYCRIICGGDGDLLKLLRMDRNQTWLLYDQSHQMITEQTIELTCKNSEMKINSRRPSIKL